MFDYAQTLADILIRIQVTDDGMYICMVDAADNELIDTTEFPTLEEAIHHAGKVLIPELRRGAESSLMYGERK